MEKHQVKLIADDQVVGKVCYYNDCNCLYFKYEITNQDYGLTQTTIVISPRLDTLVPGCNIPKDEKCCAQHYGHNVDNCSKSCYKCCTKYEDSCRCQKYDPHGSARESPYGSARDQFRHRDRHSGDSRSRDSRSRSRDSRSRSRDSRSRSRDSRSRSRDSRSRSHTTCKCLQQRSCFNPCEDKKCLNKCDNYFKEKKNCYYDRLEFTKNHQNVKCFIQKVENKWKCGTKLYIIAKGKVANNTKVENLQLTSDVGDNVQGPIFSDPFGSSGTTNPSTANWGPTKRAVEAKNWYAQPNNPILPGQSIGPATRQWNVGRTPTPDIPGVTWISTAQNTEQWWLISWRRFIKNFVIPGHPISGNILINCDDLYFVYMNDQLLGSDNNIFGPNLTYIFTVKPTQNTLTIIIKDIAQGVPGNLQDQLLNPTGLTYRALIQYYPEEEVYGFGIGFNCNNDKQGYFCMTIK